MEIIGYFLLLGFFLLGMMALTFFAQMWMFLSKKKVDKRLVSAAAVLSFLSLVNMVAQLTVFGVGVVEEWWTNVLPFTASLVLFFFMLALAMRVSR